MQKYLLIIQNIISKKIYDYELVDVGYKDYFRFEFELNGNEEDGEYTYYLIKDEGIRRVDYINDNIKNSTVIIAGQPLKNNKALIQFKGKTLIVNGEQELETTFTPIKKGLLVVGDYRKNNVQYKVNDGKTTYKQYNG
jgi:hypothetical protein